MDEHEFQTLVENEWANVPEHFRDKVQNVALLIEREPSARVKREEGLTGDETLLGLYHGVPNSVRGSSYGVGVTLPDTITLYKDPILEVARETSSPEGFRESVRKTIRETLWHEIGHYFGLSEGSIDERESRGTNKYRLK